MKILFLGRTGIHHALIAAYVFLNYSVENNFYLLDGYCDLVREKSGYPLYIGKDNQGCEVYTLGVGGEILMAKRTIEDLIEILDCSSRDLVVKPVSFKGDKLLQIVAEIPLINDTMHKIIAACIIKQQYELIYAEVKTFKKLLK